EVLRILLKTLYEEKNLFVVSDQSKMEELTNSLEQQKIPRFDKEQNKTILVFPNEITLPDNWINEFKKHNITINKNVKIWGCDFPWKIYDGKKTYLVSYFVNKNMSFSERRITYLTTDKNLYQNKLNKIEQIKAYYRGIKNEVKQSQTAFEEGVGICHNFGEITASSFRILQKKIPNLDNIIVLYCRGSIHGANHIFSQNKNGEWIFTYIDPTRNAVWNNFDMSSTTNMNLEMETKERMSPKEQALLEKIKSKENTPYVMFVGKKKIDDLTPAMQTILKQNETHEDVLSQNQKQQINPKETKKQVGLPGSFLGRIKKRLGFEWQNEEFETQKLRKKLQEIYEAVDLLRKKSEEIIKQEQNS
ncbi:MAG: hypothetical protein B6U87_03145, partial [Candidatus Aenigmarchaeota archaeon ex4484_52]